MTDVAVDKLRIRGRHARRLASVAARALPAALDRALAGVPDVTVASVRVVLDLDVSHYDDATLAILWADAIRAQVLAAGADQRRAPVSPAAAAASPSGPPGPDAVLAEARRRLETLSRAGPALPAALLRLGDPETARAVATALGPHEWSQLIGSLASTLTPPPRRDRDPSLRPAAEPGPPAHAAPAATSRADAAGRAADRPAGHASLPQPSAGPPGGQLAVLGLLAALAEIIPPGPVVIDPATVTRAAGLVLLYPWLPDYCQHAEQLHPRQDPLDVREAALAALADPDDPELADDVLVGFLAGRPSLVPRADRTRVPLAHQDEVRESADEVLASYVSLLPGFGSSSGQFIRENWIARLGVLDLDRDPALLTAATLPLDVVLPRLPFPIGLLKLPWSPPVTVRFRP